MTEGKEKCFIDEVPESVLIKGYWHLIDHLPGVAKDSVVDGVNIYIIDPDGVEIKRILTTASKFDSQGLNRGKFSLAT